ncbi:hypothetical protein [Paractinoplanes atraurantiacus]|nr:hypothetical protein [Actinoplanes atraurantiacus]
MRSSGARIAGGLAGLAIALGSLSGCTSDEAVKGEAGDAAASAGPVPDTELHGDAWVVDPEAPGSDVDSTPTATNVRHVIEELKERSGPWHSLVGAPGDTGALEALFTCDGDGSLHAVVAGASMTIPCGGTPIRNRDEAVAGGPLSVTVRPSGEQQWSLVLTRGG